MLTVFFSVDSVDGVFFTVSKNPHLFCHYILLFFHCYFSPLESVVVRYEEASKWKVSGIPFENVDDALRYGC